MYHDGWLGLGILAGLFLIVVATFMASNIGRCASGARAYGRPWRYSRAAGCEIRTPDGDWSRIR